MNKKIGRTILFLFILSTVLFIFTPAASIKADTINTIEQGVKNTGQKAGYPTDTEGLPAKDFAASMLGYVNGMSTMMGLLFMVLTIYGGWLWMTAQGNDEQVSRGKKMIIGACLGLLIILSGRIIVEFTIRNLPTSL